MMYVKKIDAPWAPLYLLSNETHLLGIENDWEAISHEVKWDKGGKVMDLAHRELDEYFRGVRKIFNVPLAPMGSPFCQKVWGSLLDIPFGEVWSYGKQAAHLNHPRAQRAVGGANGKNPIPIIIPCHRVIGSTGKLTGYSGGIEMKIALLKHEGHQIDGLQLVL